MEQGGSSPTGLEGFQNHALSISIELGLAFRDCGFIGKDGKPRTINFLECVVVVCQVLSMVVVDLVIRYTPSPFVLL